MNKLRLSALMMIFFSNALFSAHSQAQPARSAGLDEKAIADFYRGKTIRIVIGSGPGGTYDIYSRLISRHMSRFIPGNPTLLVQPRAGAGGLIAANAVYNSEPKDGTVIGSFGEISMDRQRRQYCDCMRWSDRLRDLVVSRRHSGQAVHGRDDGSRQHHL